VADIAARIWEACGNDPGELMFEQLESFEVDVQRRWPSVEKAKRVLNWTAQTDLKDGIRQTVQWLREHGTNAPAPTPTEAHA
jgi:nucleoside-diphosphate-sugar epimerase